MAKTGAMGALLLVDGYNLSGDTQQVGSMAAIQQLLDATGINVSAKERMGGRYDGAMSWSSFFNPAANQQHAVLNGLGSGATRNILFGSGSTLGTSKAFGLACLQGTYDGNRGADGSLTFGVNGQGHSAGLDVGDMLTPGVRTDGSATNGSSVNYAASTDFGWSFWWQLLAFTGTSATLHVEDSANDSTFADLSGATSPALTGIGGGRVQAATATATVRQYCRVATSGTFSNAVFVCGFAKYGALYLPS